MCYLYSVFYIKTHWGNENNVRKRKKVTRIKNVKRFYI